MARSKAVALAVALVVGGCGGSGDGSEGEPAPQPAPRESVDLLPKLPSSWERHANEPGGFALGLPPGWKARDRDTATLIRSYDRLVAVSITPDRTDSGMAIAVQDYATRAADALPGYRVGLDPRGMFEFEHRYNGAEVRADGTSNGGLEQAVSVIVLRRDELATLTAVIAANAKPAAESSERLAERVIETLRSRPPKEASKGKPR